MPGIAEHAEQAHTKEQQTGWLGDDSDGAVTDGIVPPVFVKPPAPDQ